MGANSSHAPHYPARTSLRGVGGHVARCRGRLPPRGRLDLFRSAAGFAPPRCCAWCGMTCFCPKTRATYVETHVCDSARREGRHEGQKRAVHDSPGVARPRRVRVGAESPEGHADRRSVVSFVHRLLQPPAQASPRAALGGVRVDPALATDSVAFWRGAHSFGARKKGIPRVFSSRELVLATARWVALCHRQTSASCGARSCSGVRACRVGMVSSEHVHICIFIHSHTHMITVHMFTYICTHTLIYIYFIYAHVRARVHVHVRIHTPLTTYTQTSTQLHTFAYTSAHAKSRHASPPKRCWPAVLPCAPWLSGGTTNTMCATVAVVGKFRGHRLCVSFYGC